MTATTYIEVACASKTTPHAYTIATPVDMNAASKPRVPRFCSHCRPPRVTDETGIATDRKANVNGGVFIKTWRFTEVDDFNQPIADPIPEQAA